MNLAIDMQTHFNHGETGDPPGKDGGYPTILPTDPDVSD